MSLECEMRGDWVSVMGKNCRSCLCDGVYIEIKFLGFNVMAEIVDPDFARIVWGEKKKDCIQVCFASQLSEQNTCNGNPNPRDVQASWKCLSVNKNAQ